MNGCGKQEGGMRIATLAVDSPRPPSWQPRSSRRARVTVPLF